MSSSSPSALFVPTPTPKLVPGVIPSPSSSSSASSQTFEFQSQLDLNSIRDTLIRLEESIIFALIERAQFKRNEVIYQQITDEQHPPYSPSKSSSASSGSASAADRSSSATQKKGPHSLLSDFLSETEQLHARYRRYTSPCEQSFSDPATLPQPILPQLQYPDTIKPNNINHNRQIMEFYLGTVLPSICAAGDDSNYGSSCVCDVQCLQLLSKRIHYGKFVAESKFISERESFTTAINNKDIPALTSFITKPIIEEQVLQRVRRKAATYGKPPAVGAAAAAVATSEDDEKSYKIPPTVIAGLYEHIMTLTKDVQIDYLLQRLEAEQK